MRDAIFGAIIEWYDDYISVRFETETENKDNMDTEAEEKNTEESWQAVEKARKPTEIPEGVEEVVLINNKISVLIDYYLNGTWYATYRQTVYDDSRDYVDNDGIVIQHTNIHGLDAVVIESISKNEISIVWNDGVNAYCVISQGTLEELLILAQSVR